MTNQLHILIIDDEPSMLIMLEALLARETCSSYISIPILYHSFCPIWMRCS